MPPGLRFWHPFGSTGAHFRELRSFFGGLINQQMINTPRIIKRPKSPYPCGFQEVRRSAAFD